MSSQRRPAAPGAPAGKGRPGGPAPERKTAAAKGPVVTPQVLLIVFLLIYVVMGVWFWQSVVKKSQEKVAELKSAQSTAQTNIKTYKKKKEKLEAATGLNLALRDKLGTLDYLFLLDQMSILPFLENKFFPIVDSSRLGQGGSGKIKCEEFTYEINQLMQPFNTLPSHFVDEPQSVYKMKYFPEQNGKAPTGPRPTTPTSFLKSYWIEMTEFTGTYEDVKKFIEQIQQAKQCQLITVHCVKNDEGKNARWFRTRSQWSITMTVYFINPKAAAVGDTPPDPPGSKTCK